MRSLSLHVSANDDEYSLFTSSFVDQASVA
jgi:hypothetical protein